MAISNYTKEDRNEHITPDSSFLALTPLSFSLPQICFPYCEHTIPFLQAGLTNPLRLPSSIHPWRKKSNHVSISAPWRLCSRSLPLQPPFAGSPCSSAECTASSIGFAHALLCLVAFLRQGLTTQARLSSSSESPPAFASQVLGLKVCATPPGFVSCLALALTLERGL